MSNCWKCGAELETGTECASCEKGWRHPADTFIRFTVIDWDKIKTVLDLLELLRCLGEFHLPEGGEFQQAKQGLQFWLDLRVQLNTPAHEALKKFLKE